MTDEEILIKAMQKALDGGYGHPRLKPFVMTEDYLLAKHPFEYIFSHDFAKALWPDIASGSVDPRATSPSTARPLIPTWQARLMDMVIAEDPIKYLEENID